VAAHFRWISGFHAITARLRQNPKSIQEIYIDEQREDQRAKNLIKSAEAAKIKVILSDSERLEDIARTKQHQGVIASVDANAQLAKSLDEVLETITEPPLLLVLDGIQDPHNLGACLRTADAFGVHAVIAPKDRAVGLNATVSKVACGAAEIVPYIVVTNLARAIREIKDHDIWVVGADAEAETNLYSAKLKGPLAWALGAEGDGLRRLTRELCDEIVNIPMLGSVESLNVSVTNGICLFETRRQRNLASS
jgi:23S rRNA (guanosine2251-2'-O)-methyltransferase